MGREIGRRFKREETHVYLWLMGRADSLGNTLMLGKSEGRRRRG